MFLLNACEMDYGKKPEETKELMATVSANKAVAGGDMLTFIDMSLGVEKRTWIFPGGEPATSEKAEVGVVFKQEGNIAPSLVVEYFDGSKETKTFPLKIFPVLVANFTPSKTRIKVGETVTFTDASIGGATAWSWTFEGGTPATSTDRNPTVKFDVNKPVGISLKITRAEDGSIASIVKNALVQVGPPELMYNGSFEDGLITDIQTWNGSGFPLVVVSGGANGTKYAAAFDYNNWGGAELMSRDKPAEKRIAVENGKSYTVSMWVKADKPGVITIGWFQLGNNNLSPWSYNSVWGTNGQVLTTEWQKVSFKADIPNDGKSRLNNYHSFWFTKVVGDATVNTRVYIDELSLKIVD
jgi:PKD repeat protein